MKHHIWLSNRSQDYTYTANLVPQIRGEGGDTPGNILLRAFFDALKTEALRAGHRNNKCLRTLITN